MGKPFLRTSTQEIPPRIVQPKKGEQGSSIQEANSTWEIPPRQFYPKKGHQGVPSGTPSCGIPPKKFHLANSTQKKGKQGSSSQERNSTQEILSRKFHQKQFKSIKGKQGSSSKGALPHEFHLGNSAQGIPPKNRKARKLHPGKPFLSNSTQEIPPRKFQPEKGEQRTSTHARY